MTMHDEMAPAHALVKVMPVCLVRIDATDVAVASLATLTDSRIKALEAKVEQANESATTQVNAALESHRQLHVAHDTAHTVRHIDDREALHQAQTVIVHTAELHAAAHAREHQLASEALAKADAADTIRFEQLNEARSRAADERVTFATRESLDDKTVALGDRLVLVERYAQSAGERRAIVDTTTNRVGLMETALVTITERMSQVAGTTARLEALEKTQALTAGRDHGVELSWAALLGAVAATAAVVTLIERFAR